MAQKILELIRSCGQCPHYRYNSGGTHICDKVDQIVRNPTVVAPFCPLSDFPSKVIASQAETIRAMQEEHRRAFFQPALVYIAARFKTNIGADGGSVEIPLRKQGESIRLEINSVIDSKAFPHLEVKFQCGPQVYNLLMTSTPQLTKLGTHPEIPGKEFWQDVPLAHV